jgi:hypothetical protein
MKNSKLLLTAAFCFVATFLIAQPIQKSGYTLTPAGQTINAAGGSITNLNVLRITGTAGNVALTNANSTNWITDVLNIGTPDGADMIPIVDVSTGSRKYALATEFLAGAGDVTTAQLNNASNVLRTDITNLQGATNGQNSRLNGHDTDIANLQGATNGLVADIQSTSNKVVVAAGTGGITVTSSGAGGVQTFTVNDDDAGGSTNNVATGVLFNTTSNLLTLLGGLVIPPRPGTATIDVTTNLTFYFTVGSDTNITIAGASSNVPPVELVFTQDSVGAHTITIGGVGEIHAADTNALGETMLSVYGWAGRTNAVPISTPAVLLTSYLAKGGVPASSTTNFGVINLAEGEVLMGTNHVNHPFGVAAVNIPAGGGSAGPTTNAPPYTVPIIGTNFILDWLALGATNDVILTLSAHSGLLNTNIIPGKFIRMAIEQPNEGFTYLVPNTNYFGPNFRPTSVQTGITQSTNGNYVDFIALYGFRTNAVLSGQNWGSEP